MAELTREAFLPPPVQYRVRPDPFQNRVKEENFSDSFNIFSIRFSDPRSLNKNVVSFAYAVSLTSTVLNLNSFIVLSLRI